MLPEQCAPIVVEMQQLFPAAAVFGFTIRKITLKAEGVGTVEIEGGKVANVLGPNGLPLGVKIEYHRNDMPDLALSGFWSRDFLMSITTPFFVDAICNYGDAQVRAYLGRTMLRRLRDWIVSFFRRMR